MACNRNLPSFRKNRRRGALGARMGRHGWLLSTAAKSKRDPSHGRHSGSQGCLFGTIRPGIRATDARPAPAGALPRHAPGHRRWLWHGPHLLGHPPPAPRRHQAHAARGPGDGRRGHVHGDGGPCGGTHLQHAGPPQHRHDVRLRGRPPLGLPGHGVRGRPHPVRAPRAGGGGDPHQRRVRPPGEVCRERPGLRARERRPPPGHQAHQHND